MAPVFQKLREAVLPVDGYPVSSLRDDVLANEAAIYARASGRSQSHVGHQEKKHLSRSVPRLAHGERIFAPSLEARWSAPATPRCEHVGRSTI